MRAAGVWFSPNDPDNERSFLGLWRDMLGDEAEVQSNALEVHVSSLRRKLGRELVETVRGLGYRLGEP